MSAPIELFADEQSHLTQPMTATGPNFAESAIMLPTAGSIVNGQSLPPC